MPGTAGRFWARPFFPQGTVVSPYPETMIRMIQSIAAGQAKSYFSGALAKADYYVDGQELQGVWQGLLAHRLGLRGATAKHDFFALCDNRHPATGKALTPRTRERRTVGYDINFHCPKSVSILHALSGDLNILRAFQESVTETMRMIEADSRTRVRQGGQSEDRSTGELAWAQFVHQTARPVDGHLPDPHLHAHCFTFNATWDDAEQRVKAGQFREIKRDMPYYQAAFHQTFAARLAGQGYKIRRTDKSFEIADVPQEVVALFSKRTDEIGRVAQEKGITDAKEKAELGARTRSKKQKGATMAALKESWLAQVQSIGVLPVEQEREKEATPETDPPALTAQDCLDYALAHCFERSSVTEGRRILETALRHAVGTTVPAKDIAALFAGNSHILHVSENGRQLCTTKAVLAEEQRMVELAKAGRGKVAPLYAETPALDLTGQQADAVAHVLTTAHRVSIIRGAAGVGKTTLMREAVAKIEAAGKAVVIVAPSASAAHGVLKDEEGFKEANTVARLLVDTKMQDKLKNNVLWVDEAGLLGTKEMTALLELTTRQNARLILGGDTRQHASVTRGDALRILNTVAEIPVAEVSRIYRQTKAAYRSAVYDLSQGHTAEGFLKLNRMGCIKETDPLNPGAELARDYAAALKSGKTALAVSPTHAEGHVLTERIREELRKGGLLGIKEVTAAQLKAVNYTQAQKADSRQYKAGYVVQFEQNAPGFLRGSRWQVASAGNGAVTLLSTTLGAPTKTLPLDKADRFSVFEQAQLSLAKGDKVRVTHNGFDKDKKRLNNGDVLDVVRVSKAEGLVLRNPKSKNTYTLGHDFGHLAYGHCVTSHAAQGKTADLVFIHQPAASFAASNARQFYVSVSRGREAAYVYTDDKPGLLEEASRLGNRMSAIELATIRERHQETVMQQERVEKAKDPVPAPDTKNRMKHDVEK